MNMRRVLAIGAVLVVLAFLAVSLMLVYRTDGDSDK
jgi:protein SCO1/2